MLRTADLDYHLPPGRIATHPADPRDAARLLVVHRSRPDRFEHATVRDLPSFLRAGDCLVFNTSRVLPARFAGHKPTGGRVGGLYLHDAGDRRWTVMLEGKGLKPGASIELDAPGGGPAHLQLTLIDRVPDDPGAWIVEVRDPASRPTLAFLDAIGQVPLPPYILRARRESGEPEDRADDRDRYQTVYAQSPGSVAAPTAGLHFTPDLLSRLEAASVRRADVVLHVGPGTFKPVGADTVEEHPMHAEWCSMPESTRDAILRTRAAGAGRLVCIGTTAARTVESYAAQRGDWPDALETRLLITPGYEWRWTDALLTNFHLPRSTLMALVAALFPDHGVHTLRRIYTAAIEHGYRFYSYGDAMLVLP